MQEISRRLIGGEWVTGPRDEAAGGGLPDWFMSGSGSPVDTVTPTQTGAVYFDLDSGGLYQAYGVTNVDWLALGNVAGNIGEAAGIVWRVGAALTYLMAGTRDDHAGDLYLGHAYNLWNGHSQGLTWINGAAEGDERLEARTGPTGNLVTVLANSDGDIIPANTVIVPDPTNPQEAASKAYVDAGDNPITGTGEDDAIVAQGSGTIVKSAGTNYIWQQVGDLVTINFRIGFDAGTAGESGVPIFVTFPAVPPPVTYLDGVQSCGVAHVTVGPGVWTFIEVTTIGGQARIVFDQVNTSVITDALGPGDFLSGSFSYFSGP